MRVIVASRPSPPVPEDVPAWHPLRDPAVIRPLSASAQASLPLLRKRVLLTVQN
jgi:hypothetical protein